VSNTDKTPTLVVALNHLYILKLLSASTCQRPCHVQSSIFVLLIGYKCGDGNWKGHLRIQVCHKENWKVETDSKFYYH
jgi:hypothetical protein